MIFAEKSEEISIFFENSFSVKLMASVYWAHNILCTAAKILKIYHKKRKSIKSDDVGVG